MRRGSDKNGRRGAGGGGRRGKRERGKKDITKWEEWRKSERLMKTGIEEQKTREGDTDEEEALGREDEAQGNLKARRTKRG